MSELDHWHPSWDKWGIISILALVVIPLTFGIIKAIGEKYHRDTEMTLAARVEGHLK